MQPALDHFCAPVRKMWGWCGLCRFCQSPGPHFLKRRAGLTAIKPCFDCRKLCQQGRVALGIAQAFGHVDIGGGKAVARLTRNSGRSALFRFARSGRRCHRDCLRCRCRDQNALSGRRSRINEALGTTHANSAWAPLAARECKVQNLPAFPSPVGAGQRPSSVLSSRVTRISRAA